MGPEWLLFFPTKLAHLSIDMKYAIGMRWLAYLDLGHIHFHRDFESLYEYRLHVVSKDS